MKRFKPFTPDYDKKTKRAGYRYKRMKELAKINWEEVYLKEKFWRMDYTFMKWVSNILDETMQDYEMLSEESCMYCNKLTCQFWTHKNTWLIHLCLPCLIGDKITILLEKISKWTSKLSKGSKGSKRRRTD